MKKKIGDYKYPEKQDTRSEWIHINLHLRKKWKAGDMNQVKSFLFYIYGRIFTSMSRGFYLSEGNFIMFAVEVTNRGNIMAIERAITDLKKIYLDSKQIEAITHITIDRDTKDYENGEGFLNVMDTIMEYNMIHMDQSAAHLVHCIVNSFLMPYGKESKFYQMMGKTYK